MPLVALQLVTFILGFFVYCESININAYETLTDHDIGCAGICVMLPN